MKKGFLRHVLKTVLLTALLMSLVSGALAEPYRDQTRSTQTDTDGVSISIHLTYPVTGNKKLDKAIDKKIRSMETCAMERAGELPEDAIFVSDGNYEEVRASDAVVSLLFAQYFFVAGEAYPNCAYSSMVFSLSENAQLSLEDVIDGDVVEVLQPLVQQALKREKLWSALDAAQARKALSRRSSYSAFVLTPDALLIQFQEDVLSAHDVGAPQVALSYEELGDAFRADVLE